MAAESLRIVSAIDKETASFEVNRQSTGGTQISLDIPAIEIAPVSLNDADYKKVYIPTAEFLFESELAEDGKPDLPAITTNIAIPDMAGIGFTADYESVEIINDVDIAPTQPPTPESGLEIPPFTIDSDFYSRDEFYPGDIAEVHDPVIMRDVRMVQVVMYPVQYNPVRRQLKIYRNLSVNLTYDGEEVVNPKTNRRPYISEAFLPIYQSLIPNFEELYSTLEVRRGGMLIIAKDIFRDTLQTFANWKHRKGYYVHIAPTSEIAPGGNPNQSQIYNYIDDAYDTWSVPPEYVMIVGDKDNTSVTGVPDYPYSSYSSDHSYSEVEGTDYLPDLFIARFSVDNASQLAIGLAKDMAYETDPIDDPEHWRRGLSVAGNVYATTPRLTVLWVRSLLLEYGFTDVDTSFVSSSGQVDPYLLGYFNEGPCLVSYRGWAGSSGWYAPSFSTSNLNQIQNHNKLGIMASIVCGTCNFGADECFGEKWIRMGASTTSYKGGPAAWGSTDGSTHTRWNNPLMVGYYWAIFKENNYHFAAAAVRGKIQQYNTFPRYNNSGGTIEKYFHTYNMLGDPELSVRTKPPIGLNVTHPSPIGYGLNHVTINVQDVGENPVEGAYVTLFKETGGEEELWTVSRTDADGNVTLTFNAPSPGDVFLTVSGRDYIPYQGTMEVVQDDLSLGYSAVSIDDNIYGYSWGNADGAANPGETLELTVDLRNFGDAMTASGVSATMESVDETMATVYQPQSDYDDIDPGQVVTGETPYVVRIDPAVSDGDLVDLKITSTDSSGGSWISAMQLTVEAPKFRVSAVTISDANGRLDPGETVNMILTLQNNGSIDATGITATVSNMDDYASLPVSNCAFGDIAADSSGDNSGDPLTISCDSETFDGHTINLILHTETSSGVATDVPFTVTVGQILSSDPTGPDSYGYHMFDNSDAGYVPTPTYDWVELVPSLGGQGTRLTFSSTDDASTVINLPFDFVYYGETYGAMIVCINGFAALDTFSYDMARNHWYNFFNWPIPDPGSARGQISPFWDDLSFSGSVNGVYTWYDADNHRFIIQWHSMVHRNTSAIETFQMIITDPQYYPTLTGDSEIIYQYKAIINNDSGENYSSVGFESWDELRGIEYTYDNFYDPGAATLANNKAIKITTNTGRGGIRGMVDLNSVGDNGGVTVSTSGGRHRLTSDDGSYWIKNVPPGTVDVTAGIRGWFPSTLTGINVIADQNTENVDFSLTACDIPANLDASEGLDGRVELTWDAVSHPDVVGYNVYRAHWENGVFVKLNDDPVTGTAYTDNTIPDSEIYWYVVSALYTGTYGDAESMDSEKAYGSGVVVTGAEDDTPAIPGEFFISQNYPNPFNPTTTLSYGLPIDSQVRIDIFNLLGQRVLTLVDERQTAGYKSVVWDGIDSAGKKVSSGIYFYTIEAGDYHASKKMLMIK